MYAFSYQPLAKECSFSSGKAGQRRVPKCQGDMLGSAEGGSNGLAIEHTLPMDEERVQKLQMVSSTLEALMKQQLEVDRTLQQHKLLLDTGGGGEDSAPPSTENLEGLRKLAATKEANEDVRKLFAVLMEVEEYRKSQTELEDMLKDLTRTLEVCTTYISVGGMRDAKGSELIDDKSVPREKIGLLIQTLDIVRHSVEEQQVITRPSKDFWFGNAYQQIAIFFTNRRHKNDSMSWRGFCAYWKGTVLYIRKGLTEMVNNLMSSNNPSQRSKLRISSVSVKIIFFAGA